MRSGLHLPNFGAFGDARVLADLAVAAEAAGWDGFFLWDHLLFCDLDKNAHVDPWVALTAQGMVPMEDEGDRVAELRRAAEYVRRFRDAADPFDVVVSGRSAPDARSARDIRRFEGLATWWLEDLSPLRFGLDWPALADPWDVDALAARILAGPAV